MRNDTWHTFARVGLLAVAVLVMSGSLLSDGARASAKQQEDVIKYYQDDGIMSRGDSFRLIHISSGIQRSGKVSDQDLAWVLGLMTGPPLKDTPGKRTLLQATVLVHLYYLTSLTNKQREEITRAAAPLLSSGLSAIRVNGLDLVRISRDPQALPLVQPLVNDPDKRVRERAARLAAMLQDAAPETR